jgi:CyaY protein
VIVDEQLFDQIADAELTLLERRLGEIDPDELEVELSMGVLTLTFGDDSKAVVNSHRAARQIWMAANRQAWHFSPVKEGDAWIWRTADAELRATLAQVIGARIGRSVAL